LAESGPKGKSETDSNDEEADRRDITASLAGDQVAYARLVRRHESAVAAQMWRFTRQRSLCEELVQDVFVEVYFSLGRYRGDAPFIHWVRRIASRVGYRFWKKRAREKTVVPLPELEAVSASELPIEAQEAGAVLHALLARLKPADRLVLTLMYFEDCPTREIAERMGWSRAMVKMRAYRARKKLKAMIETEHLLEGLGWIR